LNLPLSQLIQDVPTRWNSTLYLLKRLLEQRRAISIFCTETDGVSNLNLSQWTTVEQIIRTLAPFEELTRDVSGQSSLISLIIPATKALINVLEKPEVDSELKTMKEQLLKSLIKRLRNMEIHPCCAIATLLDPRFKHRCFSEFVAAQAKDNLLLAFTRWCLNENTTNVEHLEPEKTLMSISQNCDLSPWSSLDEILSLSQTKLSVSPASALRTELDIYLSE